MWLEEAGYFHIFRLFNNEEENLNITQIENDFEKLFPFLGKLEIVDSSFTRYMQCNNLNKSVGILNSNQIHYFSIPIQNEFSLIPVIADKCAQRIAEDNLEEISEFNLINLLTNN